uniref:Putative ovule protein n=1 Tax=Solanum chacoense TaxID=4108 RepID=A0A0V0HEW9_SOLCH
MGSVVRDPNLVGAPMWAPNTGWKTKKKVYSTKKMTLFWTKVFFPFVQLRLVQFKTWVIENEKSSTSVMVL